jgi:hypothetical protein
VEIRSSASPVTMARSSSASPTSVLVTSETWSTSRSKTDLGQQLVQIAAD